MSPVSRVLPMRALYWTYFQPGSCQTTWVSCIDTLFYKQLASGLMSQNWLDFQGFRDSKLLSGFLVVWPCNLCLRGIQQLSRQYLVYCWFNSYFAFITEEKLYFSLICGFLLLLSERVLSPDSCWAICHPRVSCL